MTLSLQGWHMLAIRLMIDVGGDFLYLMLLGTMIDVGGH